VSGDLPPFWAPFLALWQPKLRLWMVWDRYHRTPLAPFPCRTLPAVVRAVRARLFSYRSMPVATPSGEWIEGQICDDPRYKTCPHGIKLAHRHLLEPVDTGAGGA
jgi:hypothetical protein